MISIYFGLPRTGKTTHFAMTVFRELSLIKQGKSSYTCVCGNVKDINLEGYHYITFDMLGKYDFSDCLILIDEATIEADSRQYKVWSKDKTEFFVLHGHWRCSLQLYVQIYNRTDKTIRDITNNLYYMWKPFLVGKWFTRYIRIPFGITVPKKSKQEADGDSTEIPMGYYAPSIIDKLFAPYLYRPRWYKYFDSWNKPILPPIPDIIYRDNEVVDIDTLDIPEPISYEDIDIRSYLT